eukprot:GGOE01047702.1.p2 GENE.GGOE01047702.1~~GGOE01047702.1.p2  ORF type:complete len:123 (-),score=16.39 GGOE01047702.1:182-550(-)
MRMAFPSNERPPPPFPFPFAVPPLWEQDSSCTGCVPLPPLPSPPRSFKGEKECGTPTETMHPSGQWQCGKCNALVLLSFVVPLAIRWELVTPSDHSCKPQCSQSTTIGCAVVWCMPMSLEVV